jgi:hypothetical protein
MIDETLAGGIRSSLTGREGRAEKRMSSGLAFLLRGKMCADVVRDEPLVRVGHAAYPEESSVFRPLVWRHADVTRPLSSTAGAAMIRILFLAAICFSQAAIAGAAGDLESLHGYLAGTYRLIGQAPDSDRLYRGEVIIQSAGDKLSVTRIINRKRVVGVGTVERSAGADEADLLRVRFTENGRQYEITYLWRSDLDNYPRLSGYLYRLGKRTAAPGLEALFIAHAGG